MVNETDKKYLRRCVELAKEALEKGDRPFGSVLVSAEGDVLFEDHNHIGSGDQTQHPEFNIARWSGQNMSPEERAKATVYTSGEHCPMCSAAHGIAGLGRIVYASSSEQLGEWMDEMDVSNQSKVYGLPIQEVIKDPTVDGPVSELAEEIKELHRHYYSK
ncbi:nucleoside deaminase [Alkalibacterium iburiense]|uniref:Nucleoside deaminase n=1 Tax=Alkalibacterium iburiense TaxID=290589 RepID=A0ABN0XG84_9LACT